MARVFHNKKLTNLSKDLRTNSTKEENKLWYEFLRTLPVTVKRQKIFDHYIVDFYCATANLVIELDGSQHYEDDGVEYDKKRDEYLTSLGLTVVRYSNRDINTNFKAVCNDILNRLNIEL